MRVHTVDDEVFRGKAAETSNFKIKATGKAFKALSSSLYNRKVRAIVREVSTNALDGHIANGNPEEPFEITVPNKLFPQFVVRDYGTGMSHEMIMDQYTTYFASTKDDSNDEVGGFGLGCKSPFSYTSSFQVKSFQNGVLRVYSCYMNANGEPSVDLQLETDTDERDGIEVTVPVREGDYQEFREEIAYVISSFDVKPECSIEPAFVLNEINDEIYSAYHQELSGVNVRMGNVIYPIRDNRKVISTLYETKLYKNLTDKVVLNFNVGEVPVSMSREDLEYEPWVVDYLCERIKQVSGNLFYEIDAFYEEIKDESNGFDLMKERYGFVSRYYDNFEFINPIPYTTKYCTTLAIDNHRNALISAPLYVLDAIMKGDIDSVYDKFETEEGEKVDKRSFYNLLSASNYRGNPRRFVDNFSGKVSRVRFPDLTDEEMTIYVSKRSVGNALKHGLFKKDESYSRYYVWIHPDKLDTVKKYTDFLFGDKIKFEEGFEKGERATKPKQMYRTYLLDTASWASKPDKLDYTGCLEDAIEEAELDEEGIIWYAFHKNGKIEIPDLSSELVQTLLDKIRDDDDGTRVLLMPKKYEKEIDDYNGRIVHFKYYMYGKLNRFKRVPDNLISDDCYRAKSDFSSYGIESYKGVDLKRFKENNHVVFKKFITQRPNSRWMRKLINQYKKVIDTNDKTVIRLYDQLLEENPILEFVRTPSWYDGMSEKKRFREAIKGMINE